MFKTRCTRCCNEAGHIKAYSHVKGGICFKCNGQGYLLVKTDPEKLKAAREKRAAKREAERLERERASVRRQKDRAEKYCDDPRIGPICRKNCENEFYAYEVYKTLSDIDAGINKNSINAFTNIIE